MAVFGPIYPASYSGTDWTPFLTYAASYPLTTGATSVLRVADFGVSIPSQIDVTGIVITVECHSDLGVMKNTLARLLRAGVEVGSNLASNSNIDDHGCDPKIFGSGTNLWGTTWDNTDFNSPDFGIDLAFTWNGTFFSDATYVCRVSIQFVYQTITDETATGVAVCGGEAVVDSQINTDGKGVVCGGEALVSTGSTALISNVPVYSNPLDPELRIIYPEILIDELIEKTKNCGLHWEKIAPTVYKTGWLANSRTYDLYLSRLQGDICIIDLLRDDVPIYTATSVLEPDISVLAELVEKFLLEDRGVRLLKSIQRRLSCQSNMKEQGHGGVVLGGGALRSQSAEAGGGVVLAGESEFLQFIGGQGGVVLGGSAIVSNSVAVRSTGGVVIAGIGDDHQDMLYVYGQGILYQSGNIIPDYYPTAIFKFRTNSTFTQPVVSGADLYFPESITAYDLDAINKHLYIAYQVDNDTFEIRRTDLNGNNSVTLCELVRPETVTGFGPPLITALRYDRDGNYLWIAFQYIGYRFSLDSSLLLEFDNTLGHSAFEFIVDIAVFPDCIFTLNSGPRIYKFSKVGNQLAVVDTGVQWQYHCHCISPDVLGEQIIMGGKFYPFGVGGAFHAEVASTNKDLDVFTELYGLSGNHVVHSIVAEPSSRNIGYAWESFDPGIAEPDLKNLWQFDLDGGGIEAAGVQGFSANNNGHYMKIDVRTKPVLW